MTNNQQAAREWLTKRELLAALEQMYKFQTGDIRETPARQAAAEAMLYIQSFVETSRRAQLPEIAPPRQTQEPRHDASPH